MYDIVGGLPSNAAYLGVYDALVGETARMEAEEECSSGHLGLRWQGWPLCTGIRSSNRSGDVWCTDTVLPDGGARWTLTCSQRGGARLCWQMRWRPCC